MATLRRHGDITALFTWTLHNDRPALVLVPTFARPTHERIAPCVVQIEHAWQWEPTLGDPGYTAVWSRKYAYFLGLNPNDIATCRRIHGIITDSLSELLTMPNFPRTSEGEPAADVIAVDAESGRTIKEGTVFDV